MVFTREAQNRGDFWVRIGGKMVQPSKQAKFLGVTITQSLSWTPHVRSLITKARRATSMIKLLTEEAWLTPRSLVHLTRARALVRLRLTYGHEAFITATDSLWLDLERAELAALKAALGLPSYPVNDLVYKEVRWLPLRIAIRHTQRSTAGHPHCLHTGEGVAGFRRSCVSRGGRHEFVLLCGISFLH